MPDVRIIPASGSLQFTGSSAADSIHVQYTNSGLNFTSGSTNLMIVSSSGNVGIGTTSNVGVFPLIVRQFNYSGLLVQNSYTGTNYNSSYDGFAFWVNNDSSFAKSLITNWDNNGIYIYNSGVSPTGLAIFGTTNNVGINTTTDAGYKLDVNGTIRSTGTNGLILSDGTYAAKTWMNVYTYTIEKVGSYGISTYQLKYNDTTDALYLSSTSIRGDASYGVVMSRSIYAPHNGAFGFLTYGTTTQYTAIQALYTDNNSSGIAFNYKTANVDTEAMRITSVGNVGIGKTTPNAKLDISGSAIITGSLTVTSGITGSITTAATASKIISNGGLNGGNHYFYISTYPPAGGNVGVIQTSNLIYNSSTNTLPTTSSWATSSMSSSYVNTLVQGVVITGSLNVTAGITGSLLGTASYATQALSASWAPGGGGSSFPYTGSAQITGSLVVTGDINVTGYSGFGTTTPTVRLEVNSGDNSLMRALKVRNTGSGSAAAAVMDFKTTDNDEFSIGQFNGASGGVYNAGDVFLQNNSTTGGLSNMYIGNAGNNNRMVISHTNTVGIGFPIGSVSSTLFGVYGSADIINDLSVGSSGGSLLLQNGAGLEGRDGAGNTILNFDGAPNPTLILGPDSGITLLATSPGGGITELIDQGTFEGDYVTSQPAAQGSILSRAESGEAFDTGQLLFLSSSNQWYIADAVAVATSTPLLGIALKDAGGANDLIAVLLEGHYSTISYHDQVATPATPGSPLYVSTTAGNVTETAPTGTGDVVRLIGHNIYGAIGGRDPDVAVIRFKPDNTWIEL